MEAWQGGRRAEVAAGWRGQQDGGVARWQNGGGGRRTEVLEARKRVARWAKVVEGWRCSKVAEGWR